MSTVPVIFDIETGPLPLEVLRDIVPAFDPPAHPGEFDPRNVKYGNAKKDDKRLEILEAAKVKHAEAIERYSADLEQAERTYWAEVEAKAALSALTGEVLAIGYRGDKVILDFVGERSESMLLVKFWTMYKTLRTAGRKMVGFNINGFDIPFLVQRSWVNGVPVPDTVFTGPQRYLEQTFVDLMKVWSGGAWGTFGKLDTIARALNVGAKTPGVHGGDFARLFRDPETTQSALDYLANDLDMTFGVAERLGVA